MEELNIAAGLRKIFAQYRVIAEKAIVQVDDAALHRVEGEDNNSIAVIMRHMAGNMRSRFTDFLTSDGEKPWRDRDREFVERAATREELLADWNAGWSCFFAAVDPLTDAHLGRTVLIRNEPHTVLEALNRQLAHYAYHVGQIVLLARVYVGKDWVSMSIPRNRSQAFNAEKFKEGEKR